MNVCFDNLDDFKAELLGISEELRSKVVVRGEIQELEAQRGTKDYTAVFGFHDDRYFYEARLPCGQDFAGVGPDGSANAEVVLSQVKSICQDLGIAFRGGTYKWT